MVAYAWDNPWSSVHAHLTGHDKFGLVNIHRMLNLIGDWKHYLLEAQNHPIEEFMMHERTGRPLGSDRFIEMAESSLDRDLKKKKSGPKVIDNN